MFDSGANLKKNDSEFKNIHLANYILNLSRNETQRTTMQVTRPGSAAAHRYYGSTQSHSVVQLKKGTTPTKSFMFEQ